MKKINRLIKECIVEVLNENINRDPTKDEMIQFLNKKFGRWELANIDVEGAMYWFANFYHGGQNSNLYSVLSSGFRPGRNTRGPDKDSMEATLFDALVHEFTSNKPVDETSQPEPHDPETDTFQPSPRERTSEVPGKLKLPLTFTGPEIDWLINALVIASKKNPYQAEGKWCISLAAGLQRKKEQLSGTIKESEPPQKEQWKDTFGNKMPGEFTVEASGAVKPEKLSNSERNKIGAAFKQAGLDGNGRFEKKERGLAAVTNALDSLGFQLDMVSGDMIMGDSGSRNFIFRRKNAPGQDPFTQTNEISNSRIVFTWENLASQGQPVKFEILAYAS